MSWLVEEYFVDEADLLDAHKMGLTEAGCLKDGVE